MANRHTGARQVLDHSLDGGSRPGQKQGRGDAVTPDPLESPALSRIVVHIIEELPHLLPQFLRLGADFGRLAQDRPAGLPARSATWTTFSMA